jgi:hypothetical protein
VILTQVCWRLEPATPGPGRASGADLAARRRHRSGRRVSRTAPLTVQCTGRPLRTPYARPCAVTCTVPAAGSSCGTMKLHSRQEKGRSRKAASSAVVRPKLISEPAVGGRLATPGCSGLWAPSPWGGIGSPRAISDLYARSQPVAAVGTGEAAIGRRDVGRISATAPSHAGQP